NRTRREIALVPFGVWNAAGRVITPYLDPAVYDLLASLPADLFIDKRFHPDAIRRGYPAHAYLRFDTETGLRPVRSPNGTPADAPYYRRLLRETGAYVARLRRPRLVRRSWLASRVAYWYLRGDFSDTQLMPFAMYLAQLDGVIQWCQSRENERDADRRGQDLLVPRHEGLERRRAAHADGHADHTAECAERDGLDQKLQQDLTLRRAECLTDPDFTRALRDRHEHDVHDADAAHEQTHARDRREQQ